MQTHTGKHLAPHFGTESTTRVDPVMQVSWADSPAKMAFSPKQCPFFRMALVRCPSLRTDASTTPAAQQGHFHVCRHRADAWQHGGTQCRQA